MRCIFASMDRLEGRWYGPVVMIDSWGQARFRFVLVVVPGIICEYAAFGREFIEFKGRAHEFFQRSGWFN